ncbi:hypothetical protein DFR70_10723 [Nocardia tenerifensis]|uniref:Uncharacterized protein n=1 Tax=Nocardia tenerifensis TaxID=228006 RepID=A0A318JYM7_9NOCA|nr:hypothetical protein DFR70_10723 [Nocardia tenerifensis]
MLWLVGAALFLGFRTVFRALEGVRIRREGARFWAARLVGRARGRWVGLALVGGQGGGGLGVAGEGLAGGGVFGAC